MQRPFWSEPESQRGRPAKEQEDPITLADKSALAKTLSCLGDHEEAEALLRSVTATRDRLLGPNDASALHSTSLLADLLQYQGRHAEAEAIFRPTLLAQQRVFGPGHPNTICTGTTSPGGSPSRGSTPRWSRSSGRRWRGGATPWDNGTPTRY